MNSFQTTLTQFFQKVWTLCVTLYAKAFKKTLDDLANREDGDLSFDEFQIIAYFSPNSKIVLKKGKKKA